MNQISEIDKKKVKENIHKLQKQLVELSLRANRPNQNSPKNGFDEEFSQLLELLRTERTKLKNAGCQ